GRVHARSRPERVGAHRRVIGWDRDTAVLRDERCVLDERREISLDQSPELQVYEELIHRGIADALADAEGASMHAIRERCRGERGERPEATVVDPCVV